MSIKYVSSLDCGAAGQSPKLQESLALGGVGEKEEVS